MGCCNQAEKPAASRDAAWTLAIAGNPNCGKSALFNLLTGIRQRTGNWPGVTVDRKEGYFKLDGHDVRVIDLPGIYSLDASSLDEQVTRDYLLSREADLIVNVVDAANLERNLYLTVQLLEMGVPMVLALNMMDVARKRGIEIDVERLAGELGCPVVPIVAVSGEGLDALKAAVRDVIENGASGGFRLAHDEVIEQAVQQLLPSLADQPEANRHWLALKLLEGDAFARSLVDERLASELARLREEIESRIGEEVDIVIADSRFGHAHTLAQSVIRERGCLGRTLTDRIDQVVLHPWLGVPIFLFIMYLMFLFTINVGGAFVDFFDGASQALFVDGLGHWLAGIGAPDWLVALLARGVGGGVQVVSTFIPIVGALFLFLSVLEDSGYMARAAFVMDRFMRSIGLPGKAFVPLIVGFGCNVPAVMATRTLENVRERKLTILMNPFMSCGARLPVYVLFAAAFFPANGQNLVFAMYLIGIVVAILTGMVMKKTLLSGDSSGFMMELPPYHMPAARNVLLRTWDRVKVFIQDAGKVIIAMVIVLNLLNSIGTDGSFGNEDSDKSVLSATSKALVPVFSPMGINDENWPAVVGVVSGVLAKEVVVGTLDNLYSSLAESNQADGGEARFSLGAALSAALATIPANLAALRDAITDPLGLDVGDLGDTSATAASQGVRAGLFGEMAGRFDGRIGAFAYLLFVLLYFPCVATIGAIKREAGAPWAAFVAFWTTSIAYVTATSFYQVATWSRHPGFSLGWLVGVSLFLVALVSGLRYWSRRDDKPALRPAEVRG